MKVGYYLTQSVTIKLRQHKLTSACQCRSQFMLSKYPNREKLGNVPIIFELFSQVELEINDRNMVCVGFQYILVDSSL